MVLITENACKLKFGDKAPDFLLPGVDGPPRLGEAGKNYSLASFQDKKILVVIFSCNHCPYVQAYEDRLIALQGEFKSQGVQFVAINANNSAKYPEDNFPEMVKRAKDKRYNFPYLRDESQAVAKLYDAACTPEVYAFDAERCLRFHGRIDDNHEEPSQVKQHYLQDAIKAMLTGKKVPVPESHPMGCSIKWT